MRALSIVGWIALAIVAGTGGYIQAVEARAVPGIFAQTVTSCVQYAGLQLFNQCNNAVTLHTPLPVDWAGNKSITVFTVTDFSVLNVQCQTKTISPGNNQVIGGFFSPPTVGFSSIPLPMVTVIPNGAMGVNCTLGPNGFGRINTIVYDF